MPAKKSASHHTVPASSAMRSVSPRRGRTLAKLGMIKRETICRRSGGRPNSAASELARPTRSSRQRTAQDAPPLSDASRPATRRRQPARRGSRRPRNARTRKTSRVRMKASSMASLRRQGVDRHIGCPAVRLFPYLRQDADEVAAEDVADRCASPPTGPSRTPHGGPTALLRPPERRRIMRSRRFRRGDEATHQLERMAGILVRTVSRIENDAPERNPAIDRPFHPVAQKICAQPDIRGIRHDFGDIDRASIRRARSPILTGQLS